MNNYIKEILMENGKVIIPEIGCLMKSFSTKKVSFNQHLRFNDEILAKRIARNENVSLDSALLKVDKYVDEIKSTLKDKKEYDLGGLGELKIKGKDKLEFSPSAEILKPFDKVETKKKAEKKQKKSINDLLKGAVGGASLNETLKKKEPLKKAPAKSTEKQSLQKEKPSKNITSTLKKEVKPKVVPASNKPVEHQKEESSNRTKKVAAASAVVGASVMAAKSKDKKEPLKDKAEVKIEKKANMEKKESANEKAALKTKKPKKVLSPEQKAKKKKKRRSLLLLIFILLIVIVLFLLFWFKKDSIMSSSSDDDNTEMIDESNMDRPSESSGGTEGTEGSGSQTENSDSNLDEGVDDDASQSSNSDATSAKLTEKYYIIAGVFREKKNADYLVHLLKKMGYDAKNIGMINGAYKVAAASTNSIDDAKTALKEYKAKNKNAWLYTNN